MVFLANIGSNLEYLRTSITWLGIIDPLSQIITLPWLYPHLFFTFQLSRSKAIFLYGTLLSLMYSGRLLGRYLLLSRFAAGMLLAIGYPLLGITSSISFLCIAMLLIGCACGSVRSIDVLDRKQRSSSFSHAALKLPYVEVIYVSTIFVPLLISINYNTQSGSSSPALWPCLLAASVCVVLCFQKDLKTNRFVKIVNNLIQTKRIDAKYNASEERGLSVKSTPSIAEGLDYHTLNPPDGFLKLASGDQEKAQKLYHQTLMWREETGMDRILETPQKHFHDILKWYPHAIQGRSKEGAHVCYEILGKGNVAELTKSGVTSQDLLLHFSLRNEFIFQRCKKNSQDGCSAVNSDSDGKSSNGDEKDEELCTQLMTVLDVGGISLSQLNGDVVSYIVKSAEIIDTHYPGQVVRLVICNTPSWFSMIWSGIVRVLPESFVSKVTFVRNIRDLDEFIDSSVRPPVYGGCGVELGKGQDHSAFLAIAASWEKQSINNNLFRVSQYR